MLLLAWLPTVAAGLVLRGHADNVYAVGFAPDGRTFATGSDDGSLRLWRDGQLLDVLVEEATSVDSLHYSSDGRWLAAAVGQGRVLVWRLPSRELHKELQLPVYRNVVRFSRDSSTLAVGSRDGTLRLISTETWTARRTWDSGHGAVSGLSWSREDRTLASSSWWDDTASLWDAASGRERALLQGHSASVYCVAFNPVGESLATGSRDGTLRLWSSTGRPLACLASVPGFIHGLDWSPDGAWIATAHEDGCTRLWPAGQPVASVIGTPEPLPDAEYSLSVAFSPDSTRVASGRRWGNVRLASVPEGRLLLDVPRVPRAEVASMAVSPDERWLAVAYTDGTVALWDLPGGRLFQWLSEHRVPTREFATNAVRLWRGPLRWSGDDLVADWGPATWAAFVRGVAEAPVHAEARGLEFTARSGGDVAIGVSGRLSLWAPEGARAPHWVFALNGRVNASQAGLVRVLP